MAKTCKVCPNRAFSKGYCKRHYTLDPVNREKAKIRRSKPRSPNGNGKIPYKGKKSHHAPKKGLKRKTKSPYQRAVNLADKWFSRAIRLKFMNQGGMVQCVTSGRWYQIKEIQLGHYMSRRYMNTRWSMINAGPQSVYHNKYRNGEPQKMALWLDQEYGSGTADKARCMALLPRKTDILTIKGTAKYWREYFNELVKEKGNPWKQ